MLVIIIIDVINGIHFMAKMKSSTIYEHKIVVSWITDLLIIVWPT